MSYVLIVILFVKQNILILYSLKLTPCATKTIFVSCIFIIEFFSFGGALRKECSTEGAAQHFYAAF